MIGELMHDEIIVQLGLECALTQLMVQTDKISYDSWGANACQGANAPNLCECIILLRKAYFIVSYSLDQDYTRPNCHFDKLLWRSVTLHGGSPVFESEN